MSKNKFIAYENVFDQSTLRALFKLAGQGYFDEIESPICTGKESNVFTVLKGDERRVVKIYRTAANFKKMYEYMNADPRFSNVKGSKLTVIYTWAKKEFRNLHRSRDNGVTVPMPYAVYKNVLVMEYIPAKLLLNQTPKDPEDFYERLIKEIKKLYDDAKLVHTDLSQYNILNLDEKPVLIDFSHAVDLRYPTVKRFVKRDMLNLVNYFNKIGLNLDVEKEFERIWTAKN